MKLAMLIDFHMCIYKGISSQCLKKFEEKEAENTTLKEKLSELEVKYTDLQSQFTLLKIQVAEH